MFNFKKQRNYFRLASIPLVYLCQIFFTIPSLAFIMIGIGLFFVGTVFTMVVMLLENLMQQVMSCD